MFNIGDKVRIKTEIERFTGDPGWVDDMNFLKGREDQISYRYGGNPPTYSLEKNTWTWAESWLEIVGDPIEIAEEEMMSLFD